MLLTLMEIFPVTAMAVVVLILLFEEVGRTETCRCRIVVTNNNILLSFMETRNLVNVMIATARRNLSNIVEATIIPIMVVKTRGGKSTPLLLLLFIAAVMTADFLVVVTPATPEFTTAAVIATTSIAPDNKGVILGSTNYRVG